MAIRKTAMLTLLLLCLILEGCRQKNSDNILTGTWVFDTERYLHSPEMASNLETLGFTAKDILQGMDGMTVEYDDAITNITYSLLVQQTAELSMCELSFTEDKTFILKQYIGDLDKICVQIAKYKELEHDGNRHCLCLFDTQNKYSCLREITLEGNRLTLNEDGASLFFVKEETNEN